MNFRAVEARPLLMKRFGVPVVTSNQATIDAAFDVIGVSVNWPVAPQHRLRQQLPLLTVSSTGRRHQCLLPRAEQTYTDSAAMSAADPKRT